MNFWLDLFSRKTWEEFRNAGANVSGFPPSRRRAVQQVRKGDYFLCYLIGDKRFIGILEVLSAPYEDTAPLYSEGEYSCRLKVKPLVMLTPETAVLFHEIKSNLSFWDESAPPGAWGVYFRRSLVKWDERDGKVVIDAIRNAEAKPKETPLSPEPKCRPKTVDATEIGAVTVPEPDESEATTEQTGVQTTEHTEIQWRLLKLGSDMGCDIWVARNDRNRVYDGNRFNELPRLKTNLLLMPDPAVNSTIELIDVLWLRGNQIIAAFEIESTTSIYSGLLRMADLIAMIQNINIPLFIVAPDRRREKVITEINRPTFRNLSPPLREICRYIPFDRLRAGVNRTEAFIRFLRPEFLEDLSESCEIDD